MFQGTLPHKAIKIIGNIVKEWNVDRVYVGCSGNFTIERSISGLLDCKITSNDVTIYSSNIGKYFSGQSLNELCIKEEYDGECNFLRDYMNNDTEKVATMMLASDILPYSFDNNLYCKRMMKGYKEQFPRMHKSLCERLESMKTNIDSFYHGDVMNMLDEIPENCGFISFPPFFKGGYEKMWKEIENFFEYTEPEYEMFDPDVHIKEFCHKVSRLDNFVIGTERPVEELEEYYTGIMQTPKGKNIYFYSKSDKKHFVAPTTKDLTCEPILKIEENDKVEWPIFMKKINDKQYFMLRATYLSTGVDRTDPYKGGPSLAMGLYTSEGKMFGMFALSNSMMLGSSNKLEKPTVYMITDLAISPTCEKNLSKLVLYCALSKETKIHIEKVMGKRVNSVATNAFSKNPTSMKYRGLFEQLGRRELEKDENGKTTKWNLSYGAKMGQWSLEEGYKLWKQKSSK